MKAADSKKLDHIITMLDDMVATFGTRFDKLDAALRDQMRKLNQIGERLLAEMH